ncbi:BEN domain-containing protein 5-like [Ornithodoros turicata]|uniref:BEN domain-containing protein 5-like n=1 Tax=Ornithodoros turicata TaxID=34597 RepID=UPI0031393A91
MLTAVASKLTMLPGNSEQTGSSQATDMNDSVLFGASDEEAKESSEVHDTYTWTEPPGHPFGETPSQLSSSERLRHDRHIDTALTSPPSQACQVITTVSAAPSPESIGTFDINLSHLKPLTKLDDGRFHIRNGFVLTESQATKIFKNKRPTLVMKDMAQAIWGNEVLAARTYSGRTAPKDSRDTDIQARKEPTPTKVALVIDAVTYWGSQNAVDVTSHIEKRGVILSEKIQDLRKSTKRRLPLCSS